LNKIPLFTVITTLMAVIIIIFIIFKDQFFPKTAGSSWLEIVNANSGKVYERFLIEDQEFSIEFIHSVNNSIVKETFKAKGDKIKPVQTRFFTFGAGMLTELDDGLTMERDGYASGGAYVITGFNNTFTELNYIVGTVSDHILLINDERISLTELCGKNTHIVLRLK